MLAAINRNIYPDTFLADANLDGGGIYCLYCPADMNNEKLMDICGDIARILKTLHIFVEKGGFAIITQCSHAEREERFELASRALQASGLSAGVAGPYASCLLARGSMEKARNTALFGKHAGECPLLFVSKLRWQTFCKESEYSIRKENCVLEDFLVSAIVRALKYDAANGTMFFMSIYQYLLCGKSLRHAAEKLSIHRNTLDYRINRVKDLFDIDFNDRHSCFELLFSCKLYEGMEQAYGFEIGSAAVIDDTLQTRLWEALRRSEHSPCVTLMPNEERRSFVMLYIDSSELNEKQWSDLYSKVRQIPNEAYAFDDTSIVALYEEDPSSALARIIKNFDVKCALSNPFMGERLANKIELLRQTLCAGRRIHPNKWLYRFDELASFVFFLVTQKNINLSNYLSEEVLRVMHYDYEKNTELSRSLYVYLFYFMDLKKAALELNVHRNTLDYQIKKIGQILGELPDTSKRFDMMCTYGMLAMSQD